MSGSSSNGKKVAFIASASVELVNMATRIRDLCTEATKLGLPREHTHELCYLATKLQKESIRFEMLLSDDEQKRDVG